MTGIIDQLKWEIIMKSLDPLRAKKTFMRKKLGHTAVSAINKPQEEEEG